MFISDESIRALELDGLLRLVADGAATDLGRDRILRLRPSSDGAAIDADLERGREVGRLLADGPLVPFFEEPLSGLLEDLVGRRTEIDGVHLVRIGQLLAVTAAARERIESAEPPAPALLDSTRPLLDLSDLAQRLGKALDERGRVRDNASPRLASLRRHAQRVRQRAYSVLEGYARDNDEELAGDTIPFHDDRLVVLLRSGSKGRLPGLVHGRSGSGQSLYFEPLEVVDANNELRAARDEEEAERRRILEELIEMTVDCREALGEHLEFLVGLDRWQAAARWAGRCKGLWIMPAPGVPFVFETARHPLLDPDLGSARERALGQRGHHGELVPLSIELSEAQRILVITGPNAGGKTVALKTLGLLALAAHCGLPVPVGAGSRIPLLERVVASVGDEQDLLADRSTFSGRLLRLKEAWEWAGPATLVLLDELGSGTDPEEGAALSIGLVEGLLEKRAFGVVSSHLTRLAAAALDLEGAACSAMAFDTATGRPTFQLIAGTPGGSEAIALARRLELDADWVDRAEAMLGPDHGRLQQLLAEVESVRGELALELDRVRSETRRLQSELAAAEEARSALEAAEKRAGKEAQQAVGEFRRKVRRRLGREIERLEQEMQAGRRRGLGAEALDELFRDAPVPETERSTEPVEPGGRVRHRGLGWEGTVEKMTGSRVEVTVKGKRMVCRLDELDGLAAREPDAGPRQASRSVSMPTVEEIPDKELHLLGKRVEAALESMDAYLDRALLAGMPEVRIVHGHGTGRLKRAVREALESHPAVAKWRPGGKAEGGDGATVVTVAG